MVFGRLFFPSSSHLPFTDLCLVSLQSFDLFNFGIIWDHFGKPDTYESQAYSTLKDLILEMVNDR